MSIAQKEKLINLVRPHPALWRQSRKAPGLKQKIWDEIGFEMDTSGHDARRQWEILRDQLRRENKRYKMIPNYKSKWMFYEKMMFTNLQVQPDPAAVVNDEIKMESCNSFSLPPKNEGEQIFEVNNVVHHQREFIPQINSTPAGQIIHVRQDLQESNDSSFYQPSGDDYSTEPSISAGVSSSTQVPRINMDKEDIELCERKRNTNSRRFPDFAAEDEDYHFAMSLVPSMRCIRRSKKLAVRSKIMNLIAEALEMEDVYEQGNSGQFNLSGDEHSIEVEEKIIPVEMVQTSME